MDFLSPLICGIAEFLSVFLAASWTAGRPICPKACCLKSDGFASSIYDPAGDSPCGSSARSVVLNTRIRASRSASIPSAPNGDAFKARLVPEFEDKLVTSVERGADGFRVGLDSGELFNARRLIMAVGITHFEYTPANLATLPVSFYRTVFVTTIWRSSAAAAWW